MKIDKAIEILSDPDHYLKLVLAADHIDAIKLGIEALKRLKDWRETIQPFAVKKLPGETEGG